MRTPALTTIWETCFTIRCDATKRSSTGRRRAVSIPRSPSPGEISASLASTSAGKLAERLNAMRKPFAPILPTPGCCMSSINYASAPGSAPATRLEELERQADLIALRDDLTVELITLYNLTGQSSKALAKLAGRRFHPWEGGEGLVSGQYVAAHLLSGLEALDSSDADRALRHFVEAGSYPHNLGEGKHLLTPEAHLHYFAGVALDRLGRGEEARDSWRKAAASGEGMTMFTYYRALALQRLGQEIAAGQLLRDLRMFAEEREDAEMKIDYFATSLPNFLLFEDDVQERNRTECQFLKALANLGLGEFVAAEAGLRQVLARDVNHLFARIELERMHTDRRVTK